METFRVEIIEEVTSTVYVQAEDKAKALELAKEKIEHAAENGLPTMFATEAREIRCFIEPISDNNE